jgi:hypothetical protein
MQEGIYEVKKNKMKHYHTATVAEVNHGIVKDLTEMYGCNMPYILFYNRFLKLFRERKPDSTTPRNHVIEYFYDEVYMAMDMKHN